MCVKSTKKSDQILWLLFVGKWLFNHLYTIFNTCLTHTHMQCLLFNTHVCFSSPQAYYIKYKSFSKEQKLDQAKKCLQHAVEYTPEDESIRKAFKSLEQAHAREDAIEKRSMSEMAEKMGWKDWYIRKEGWITDINFVIYIVWL